MTRKIPNLIIVAGDGRNSGKTSMCARIIMGSGVSVITAIKISPHFHEPSDGLKLLTEGKGFAIYEETNRETQKDSSVILRAGAKKVYYIQATDESTEVAFSGVLKFIPAGNPIICESPSLIRHFEPGVFIIMVSEEKQGRKDISEMKKHFHLEFTIAALKQTITLPFRWTGKEWTGS
jgi:hypothetical protein